MEGPALIQILAIILACVFQGFKESIVRKVGLLFVQVSFSIDLYLLLFFQLSEKYFVS